MLFALVLCSLLAACKRNGGAKLAEYYKYDPTLPLQAQVEVVHDTSSFTLYEEKFFAAVEPLHFVEAIAPRPLLMINAKRDELVPLPATEALYKKAKQPKRIIWYDTKHSAVPVEAASREACNWLEEHFKKAGSCFPILSALARRFIRS